MTLEKRKTYKFNDFPLNMMSWQGKGYIEAQFNLGNPREGDIIIYGAQRFLITDVKTVDPLDYLSVKPVIREWR